MYSEYPRIPAKHSVPDKQVFGLFEKSRTNTVLRVEHCKPAWKKCVKPKFDRNLIAIITVDLYTDHYHNMVMV